MDAASDLWFRGQSGHWTDAVLCEAGFVVGSPVASNAVAILVYSPSGT
jgi:hypothetical protein